MDESHQLNAIHTSTSFYRQRPAPIKKKPSLAFTVTRSISVSFSADEIMKALMECAQKEGFIGIKSFQDELLLQHKGITSKWFNFLRRFCQPQQPLLLRCSLTTDAYQRSRHLVVQNVTPCRDDDTKRIMSIITRFDSQFVFVNSQIPVEIDDECLEDGTCLVAASSFMFKKMLVERNYSLGQKCLQFVESMKPSKILRNDIWHLEQMKKQLVNDMLKNFNCTRKQLNQILPYCSSMVEDFLYHRVYLELLAQPDNLTDFTEAQPFLNTKRQVKKWCQIWAPSIQIIQVSVILQTFDYQHSKIAQKPPKKQALRDILKQDAKTINQRITMLNFYQQFNGHSQTLRSFNLYTSQPL